MAESKVFGLNLGEKQFKEATGKTFVGLSLNLKESGWMCVIRASDKDDELFYAINEADGPTEALNSLFEVLCSPYAQAFWRRDKG